jgi:predicted Fe-Mo cluster-binding NifX family protein
MASRRAFAATSDLPRLAAPAMRALSGAGITCLAELSRRREADIVALHGMGPNALATLKAAMKAKGVSFAKR